MSALLIGNYGKDNFGDEVLREYFLSTFRCADGAELTEITFVQNKGELPRLPTGFRSFFCTPWWRTVVAMYKSKAIVFGGGTLFTDIESVRACILWGLHVGVARLLGCKVALAFQGFGPFRTKLGRFLATCAVRGVHYISVRDAASFQRVQTLVKNKNIIQSFDPAITLFKAKKPANSSKNVFVIIPRVNSPKAFLERATALAQKPDWSGIRILSFEPDARDERMRCEALLRAIPQAVLIPVRTTDDLVKGFMNAAFLFTQRYHGAIAAKAFDVPMEILAQEKGDKLSSVTEGDAEFYHKLVQEGELSLKEWLAAFS